MARILIVGCGCRGRSLAASLAADGHAVRGTTRDPARLADIDAAGAEAVTADPDRLGTLLPALEGVSALCWLMGTAAHNAEALHGPRLEALVEKLVDTPVRGIVYEAAGSVPSALLDDGAAIVRLGAARWSMPAAVVDADPSDPAAWVAAMRRGVDEVLSG